MARANQLSKGNAVLRDGKLFTVFDIEHVAKGNKRSYYQVKFRNFETGQIIDQRLRVDEDVEIVFVENVDMEYVFSNGNVHTFMDTKTYEQLEVQDDLVHDEMQFLVPNTPVQIKKYEGNPIGIDIPDKIALEVTDTPPGIKGATVTQVTKPATLETGLVVQVPAFIETGEKIVVDTRSKDYIGRDKG